MNVGDVFGEEDEEISLMVVTDIGGEGFRLAERYYDEGEPKWTHYWCPVSEFDSRDTHKVSEKNDIVLKAAHECLVATDLQAVEEAHGLR